MRIFNRRQWSILALVLLFLLIGLGCRAFRHNPRVERVKKLREELFSVSAASDRRDRMEALRREQEKLTPAERKELGEAFRKDREAELERYAKLSKEEKTKFLDERIDQMQAMQASMANRPRGNGADNPPGGRSSPSAEDRERRRKEWLDSTTPEQRALRDQFMKDLSTRLAQRGLPSSPFGPRGPR